MDAPHTSLRAFAAIACGYWTLPGSRGVAWLLTGAIVALTGINVGISLRLNIWNRDFFNALERRDLDSLLGLLWSLAGLVVATAVTVAAHLHVRRRLQVDWRAWLTTLTARRWLHAGRQYQLGLLAGDCDNPDGRIAEDIRIATEMAIDFGYTIVQCVLQLIVFMGVLWSLSGWWPVHIGGRTIDVPGYMVWVAILYAVVGSLLTYLLGRMLIAAGNARQAREADLRAVLIRARENAEGIALMRGEADERGRVREAYAALRRAWNTQTRGQGRLALLTNALAVLAPVVPLVMALPRFLAGEIALGGLMQTAQAFSSVQWALSWLIENFSRFAEWRASSDRVVHLHYALSDLEESLAGPGGERVELQQGTGDRLRMRGLGLSRPDGEALVADTAIEIRRSERVLIRGESGSGKSTIMRAIAGVWPWGRGAVHLPEGDFVFLPQKPYLPPGTLRDVLLYPKAREVASDEALMQALEKLDLGHLAGRLDETARWDHILSGGEQQRVAFARVLLQRPAWIFMDEATSALDEKGQEMVMRLLMEELSDSALISIGHRAGLEVFHSRELVLVPGEEGAELRPARVGQRSFVNLYRSMSAAGRLDPMLPGFWTAFRTSLLGR